MESAKSKRKSIQLSEKVAIIHEIENGKKQVDVIKERKLAQSTMFKIFGKIEPKFYKIIWNSRLDLKKQEKPHFLLSTPL